ncbi:wall-associated receptor kinase 2-like [Rosa rugosa]|uniref:wall-associated receptor kinase 2-like n=1 Tax=Rosa rugosa TaxID=74645 RepID=UPI002B411894|nr:wall-associated receptor kinase 2-like [Rosa rugosa]
MSIMALQFPLAAVLILLSAASTTTTAAAAQALPGCSDKCGDLAIPYPFGMKVGCYLGDRFYINCSQGAQPDQPPTAYFGDSNIIVTNISIDVGELRIWNYRGTDCYNKEGNRTYRNRPEFRMGPPYTISDIKNKFYAIGCDTYAIMRGFRGEEEFITGCMSVCNSRGSVDKNSCSGAGCCQINIPSGLNNLTVSLSSYDNHLYVWDFNPCSYAFIVQEDQFDFSSSSFEQLNDTVRLPMVLNWAIGNDTDPCHEAQKRKDFACRANSMCKNRPIIGSVGYLCECLPGYEGNPYHPDGCQDIDECRAFNSCQNGQCLNTSPGNYSCSCHKGYKNDGMNDKTCIKDDSERHSKIVLLLMVSLGVTVGFLVLFLGISWKCWGMKKREFIKLKEKHFKENGGLLLLQQLASHGSSMRTTKIFPAEELEKATNNYHESRVLGEGGYGTVYKGILPDDTMVAIKKSKGGALTQSDQFVNEVIVLSQINHKNVVKLLGCCLETEVPLLVYEFITHGTLYEHIHKKRSSLPFELRMKIATQSAEALSHLHSSISTPIIHRDVKTANILLDDDYTAKVSDFGASRLVPSGQTDIQTLVLGTFGYLDPEYLQSNQLTEKSDVYSFGVVLVELLTSKMPVSKDRCLASIFLASMEEGWLNQILDDGIVNEGNIETVKKVANLAKQCLRVNGEERPSMKEVAKELEEMNVTAKYPWRFNANFCEEENEYLLGSVNSDAYVVGNGKGDCSSSGLTGGTTTAYDSMQIEQLMPHDGGR